MHLIGYDIGSSFVKATLVDGESGQSIASSQSPESEMEITALKPGWAEQDPELWWKNVKTVTAKILSQVSVKAEDIRAVGISYQMHGLVLVDKNLKVLRPAIIWCDSRAAAIGEKAFKELGPENCLEHLLNSPGNFTASKLCWVKENEPEVFVRIYKMMLPGDFIALKMSGQIQTTISGLSEGILWDYKEEDIANTLLKHYNISPELVPEIVDNFSIQCELSASVAKELGLQAGTKITYRVGDQPNNAFSLNCLNPGEVATTAGTSGVIYGVSGKTKYDHQSRVNIFTHVNHTKENPRYGILLCVNGAGILNSWLKRFLGSGGDISYETMNELAACAPPGSEGLLFYPFGNGAERIFENRNTGSSLRGFHFNTHNANHVLRAAQEGVVFALNYGLEIMRGMDVNTKVIRAGEANMFLSPVFANAFATLTGVEIELYNTNGAEGAARGAGLGAGFYKSFPEAFNKLRKIRTIEPDKNLVPVYRDAYGHWLDHLNKILSE